jgi:cold shock CspA family protein
MRGTLTRFNQEDGIGAIISDQGIEVLVYRDSVDAPSAPLRKGQTVEFRIYYGPFGPLAENVHRG